MTKSPPKHQSKFASALVERLSRMGSLKLFYLSVICLILAGVGLTSAVVIQHSTPKVPLTPTPASGFGVHTPISIGLVSLELSSINFKDNEPGFSSSDNQHYVIVDLTVKNNADHPINVLPSSDTYLKDAAGNVTYLTPFGLTQPFHAGELLPGEQVKGQLSYIGAKTGSLKLYIDSSWSGGLVPFKVQ